MPDEIDTDALLRLIDEGAQVVEVLPTSAFGVEHIAGAVNIPLADLHGAAATAALDRSRPVVAYCFDYQ